VTAPLLILGILFGSNYAAREERRFERLAAAEIATKLTGDNKLVAVNIRPDGLNALRGGLTLAEIRANTFSLTELPLFTEPDRPTTGRIDLLSLRLTDFTLRKLRIRSLTADIPDCRYDFQLAKNEGTMRLSRSGEGNGSVTVTAEDLARFMEDKYAEIITAEVTLDKNWLYAEGESQFLVVKARYQLFAKLHSPDGRRLELTNVKLYFDWNRADAFAMQAVLRILNPVVDIDKDLGLFGAIDVTSIALDKNLLTATGKTRMPVKPSDNPPR